MTQSLCLIRCWLLTASVVLPVVLARAQPVLFAPDFSGDTWRKTMRQNGGSERNVVRPTMVEGRPALLLYDNDATHSTVVDALLELPSRGVLRGFLRFPGTHAGAPNKANAYIAVQLFPAIGSTSVSISCHRNTGKVAVGRRLGDQRDVVVDLPEAILDEVWVPWQIAWEWDDENGTGRCRVAVYDKETDPVAYDGGPFARIRLVSGWSNAVSNSVYVADLSVSADATALERSLPEHLRCRPPFSVTSRHVVFLDTFAIPGDKAGAAPDGWDNWQPDNDAGLMLYDRAYGRRDRASVCLDRTRRSVWQRKVPAAPGAVYRASGWVRVEKAAATASVALAMQPRGILRTTGKEGWLRGRNVAHRITPEPGYWHYLETFWTAPDSGEFTDGKFTLLDVEFLGQQLTGKAWCDDVRLEIVEITAPWYHDFRERGPTLQQWRIYAPRGLEGQASVAWQADGFADGGAIAVRHDRGQNGFSAACSVPRATFGRVRNWTLVAHATAADGSTPRIAAEQLDSEGQILTRAIDDAAQVTGWRLHALTFDLLPRTTRVRVLLTNDGAGTASFDNVWIRPAQADEIEIDAETFPVMGRVFPADVVAAIDRTPALLALPSRQTGAFVLHLYGDTERTGTTRVELETPEWLELRTAQMATYGKAPLPVGRSAAGTPGRTVFSFVDPYPWQQWQKGGEPNPYTGLITLWRAAADPGTTGTIDIRLYVEKDAGQRRTLKVAVRKRIARVPELSRFQVGIWGLGWLHVRDPEAHRELLQTYVDAGVRRGSMHESHGFAVPVMEAVGFQPTAGLHAVCSPLPYRRVAEVERPPMAVTDTGQETSHYIALGVALNDAGAHAAYRDHLRSYLRGFPSSARHGVLDIEFWGDGSVSRTDFHPETVAEFRRRSQIPANVELTPAAILREHHDAWSEFRNALTAELHGTSRRLLREVWPDMELWAYDYPLGDGGAAPAFVKESPMNPLLYEPHIDGHLISYYNREGVQFADAVDNDAAHLAKPVWAVPFLMKNISNIYNANYNYYQITTAELRFEIVAAAASGAMGHFGFPGKLMDADYLHAYAEGVTAVARWEDHYTQGERRDATVDVTSDSDNVRHRVHVWRDTTLLTLLNGGDAPAEATVPAAGGTRDIQLPGRGFAQLVLE